jgi:hypothetical protein
MSFTVSWWLLALVVGATAPLWIRAIVNRWERRAQRRSERIVAQFEREPPNDEDGDPDESDL